MGHFTAQEVVVPRLGDARSYPLTELEYLLLKDEAALKALSQTRKKWNNLAGGAGFGVLGVLGSPGATSEFLRGDLLSVAVLILLASLAFGGLIASRATGELIAAQKLRSAELLNSRIEATYKAADQPSKQTSFDFEEPASERSRVLQYRYEQPVDLSAEESTVEAPRRGPSWIRKLLDRFVALVP